MSYEDWLLAQGLSESTVGEYQRKLDQAKRVASDQGWSLTQMTPSQVDWLASQFPQTRATLGVLRAALGHFWDLSDAPDLVGVINLPSPPAVEEYRGLEDDEAYRVESKAFDVGYPKGTLVLLGLYLALRRAEMVGLRLRHFENEMTWVRILGKGRRERILPVHTVLQDVLKGLEVDDYLFPGKTGPHIHPGTVYVWMVEVGELAGVEGMNPHSLRHTSLTHMYERTGDLRAVQYFAGHSDPQTTARYTRVTRKRLEGAVAALDYRVEAA